MLSNIILYIGKDDNYYKLFCEKFYGKIDSFSIDFLDVETSLQAVFEFAKETKPKLIVIDGYERDDYVDKIVQSLKHCDIIPQAYFVRLILAADEPRLKHRLAFGDVLYYHKSFEVEDLIYLTLSLLLPEHVRKLQTAKAFFFDVVEAQIPLKVDQITRRSAKLESNHRFDSQQLYRLHFPFYPQIFKQQVHELSGPYTDNIQSQLKYRYELTFKFFPETLKHEDRLKMIGEFNYMLQSAGINKQLYEAIEKVTQPKKLSLVDEGPKQAQTGEEAEKLKSKNHLELMAKCYFRYILECEEKKGSGEKDHIVIYDSQYSLIAHDLKQLSDEMIYPIMRYRIADAAKEILRDRPSLIVVNYNHDNGFDQVKALVASTTQVRDYFPYVLLFNYHDMPVEKLRDLMEYHFIVAMPFPLQEDIILRMMKIYRDKKLEKEVKRSMKAFEELKKLHSLPSSVDSRILYERTVYPKDNAKSVFYHGMRIHLVWMSEFEIVFKSSHIFEAGEILLLNTPVKMNLLVLEHDENAAEAKLEKSYRGIIHCVEEDDKAAIRRFVNEVFRVNNMRESSLTQKELDEIKLQYFNTNQELSR